METAILPRSLENQSSDQGPKRPHKHKDLTFWSQGPIANTRGIPKIMVGRILMFLWSFGPLQMRLVFRAESVKSTAIQVFAIGDCAVSGKPPTAQAACRVLHVTLFSGVCDSSLKAPSQPLSGGVPTRPLFCKKSTRKGFQEAWHCSLSGCDLQSQALRPCKQGKYLGRMFRLGKEHMIPDPAARLLRSAKELKQGMSLHWAWFENCETGNS